MASQQHLAKPPEVFISPSSFDGGQQPSSSTPPAVDFSDILRASEKSSMAETLTGSDHILVESSPQKNKLSTSEEVRTDRRRFNSFTSYLSIAPGDLKTHRSSDGTRLYDKSCLNKSSRSAQNLTTENGQRKRVGKRDLSPVAFGHGRLSVSKEPERPQTYEEELRNDLIKSKACVLQLQRRLTEEKRENERLTDQLKTQDQNYKGLVEKICFRYEERLSASNEKSSLLLGECEQLKVVNAELSEEISIIQNSCSEKTELIQKLEDLILESQQTPLFLDQKVLNSETALTKSDSSYSLPAVCNKRSDDSECHEVAANENKPWEKTCESLCFGAEITKNGISAGEGNLDYQWDGLYKVLYEMCLNKLSVLEESQQKQQVKDILRSSLTDYGTLDEELPPAQTHDRTSECNSLKTDGQIVPVRRSSSCPSLAELDASKVSFDSQSPHSSVYPSQDADEGPASFPLTGLIDSAAAVRRPTSIHLTDPLVDSSPIPLSNEKKNFSSASPSPIRESPLDVFSREKLQYRHVRIRQPKRTSSDRQSKATTANDELKNTNSLPTNSTATSTFSKESVAHREKDDPPPERKSSGSSMSPSHSVGKGMMTNPIQSNFERLCQRRNGLISAEIRCHHVERARPHSLIDKLGLNLKSYIHHGKGRRDEE